jgi:hypothetical protein
MTVTDSPERQRRIAAAWSARPGAALAEVEAAVDADLELEAAEQVEAVARAGALAESATALMFRCAACGAIRSPSAPDALCDACRSVHVLLAGEQAAADQVDGQSRRELVAAYRARRAESSP